MGCRAAVAGFMALLVACAGMPGDASGRMLRPDGLAVLEDAYAIAHGMAAGYVSLPHARPEVVAQLALLDARAAAALRAYRRSPNRERRLATAAAVAALTDFEASQAFARR